MNQVMTLDPAFNQPLPTVFQGMDAGDDLSGGITGGYGLLRIRGKVFTIHFQQQEITLMRDDGDGPKGSVEIVILKANPHLSKTWYENGWDENNSSPPDCASANGVVPDAGVPKRQSTACANCPRNQWGTGANGGKGKACADHRRLAIVPLLDLNNETFGGPMLLRCPAASLQDLAAFDAKYKAAGYPYFSLGVRVAFDPKESFPKLVFSAIRPLGEQEAALVIQLRNNDATARVIADAAPVVAPQDTPPPAVTFEQPPQQPAQPPIQAQQAPVQQAAPAPAPAAHAPNPAAAPVQPTGFGAAAPARPAQTAQQAPQQPQRPSQTMTGFGAAAPQPAAQQAQPRPAQSAQSVQPQQVTAQAQPPLPGSGPVDFASSLDDRLAGLLGS